MTSLGKEGDRLSAEAALRGIDSARVHETILGVLMDTYLMQISSSPDQPTFLPCTGYFQKLGSPNPDTIYRGATIDPEGTYLIRGVRGTAHDVTLMPFSSVMRGGEPLNLTTISQGKTGGFELLVSAQRPQTHSGNWWQLQPDTASIWLREVSANWGQESPTELAIVRLDTKPYKHISVDEMNAKLAKIATRVGRIVEYGMKHVDTLQEQGFINSFRETDYSKSGSMPLQSYHEAVFDLAADECLLVEARLPSECNYFSWSLTDRMLVTLDWMNVQTSINSAQATIDPDGVLRVVVAASDPGVPNWMNTLGLQQGVIQCRTAGSSTAPDMNATVVPLAEINSRMPATTRRIKADERSAALQERMLAWQLRRIW
jgi:hypothetical protein